MKKLLSIALSVIIFICAFALPTFAQENELTYEERIYSAISNMETQIDLSEYKVKVDDAFTYLQYLVYQHPELYYWDILYEECRQNDKEELVKLAFTYDRTKDQMLIERMFIENQTNKVIEKIDENWSDAEKALYVHDWLSVNFMYDYDLFEEPGTENHDILNFLKEKRGVCESYANTYMYILRRIGINSYLVVSEEDAHGWNVVQIDGKWYHVDVTNDDPILSVEGQPPYHYDYIGEVEHKKFLLSDSEIIADDSHDNFFIPGVEGIVCESYTGNDSWRTATTAVHKIGEYWYYLDNSKDAGGLMRTKDFKNAERIMEIGRYVESWGFYGWVRDDGRIQGNYYAGLFEYNGHLFFNTEKEIYVYDSHHNVFKTVPIDRPAGKYYYGLNMDGKTITYLASADDLLHNVVEGEYVLGVDIKHLYTDWEIIKNPTETEDGAKVKFCYYCADIVERQTIPSLGSVVLGDANGDRNVNAADLATLKLHLAGINKDIGLGADMDMNGIVNASDLASLKLKLAGL